LKKLFNKSIYIIRETYAKYKNPAICWAGGKDSTLMLYIAKQAFMGKVPIPIVFIHTTFQFRETYEFVQTIRKMWDLDLIYAQNRQALAKGVSPFTHSKMECCTLLKTEALRKTIEDKGFDALMFDIWRFTRKYNIPINPLYNKVIDGRKYRSLGCYPCTKPLSDEEYRKLGERGGRAMDKEEIMERLRALGYM